MRCNWFAFESICFKCESGNGFFMLKFTRFRIFTTMFLKIQVFWNLTPFWFLNIYRGFEGTTFILHFSKVSNFYLLPLLASFISRFTLRKLNSWYSVNEYSIKPSFIPNRNNFCIREAYDSMSQNFKRWWIIDFCLFSREGKYDSVSVHEG